MSDEQPKRDAVPSPCPLCGEVVAEVEDGRVKVVGCPCGHLGTVPVSLLREWHREVMRRNAR